MTLNYSIQVLEFVDEHGNEVLNLGSFTLLPQHVVRLILAREELRADEFTKFQVHVTIVYKFPDILKSNIMISLVGTSLISSQIRPYLIFACVFFFMLFLPLLLDGHCCK